MPAQWRVPLADVHVDDELRAAVDEVVSSGWWSMGPRVEELEEAFGRALGTPNAIAVSSGTAALHLALLALEIGPEDEVLVTSLNFVAVANTIVHVGAKPVFCDIGGASDLNVDPADLAAAVTPRTKAVVAMHYGGNPCAMDEIRAFARRHSLAVIEDAAHAPGATYRGQPCGTIGDIGCFSFFANKNLPTGEGGMVVTADPELARRLRLLRSHGMTTLTWDRHRGHAHTYDVVTAGLNYRLDEFRAAIGLIQLARLETENAARERVVAQYRRAFDGTDGITVPFGGTSDESRAAYHLAVIVLGSERERDHVRGSLQQTGIQTSVHYPPIHRFSYYRGRDPRDLPHTDDIGARVLTLPLYGGLDEADVQIVIDAVHGALSDDA